MTLLLIDVLSHLDEHDLQKEDLRQNEFVPLHEIILQLHQIQYYFLLMSLLIILLASIL